MLAENAELETCFEVVGREKEYFRKKHMEDGIELEKRLRKIAELKAELERATAINVKLREKLGDKWFDEIVFRK